MPTFDMGGWGYDPVATMTGTSSGNLTDSQYAAILGRIVSGNSNAGPTSRLRFNIPTIGLGLKGIGALGSLYSDISQIGLAKKAFNLQKQVTNANYANQAKAYNTALTDRITSRGVQEGLSSNDVNNYIKNNSVSTTL